MKTKIVYLYLRNGFRSGLRSDTLWASLCWTILMLYDKKVLEDFIESYTNSSSSQQPIYLSSAFPFLMKEGTAIPYVPIPFKKVKPKGNANKTSFEEELTLSRARKKAEKKGDFIPLTQLVGGYAQALIDLKSDCYQLERKIQPTTHNTIDRIQGSTLSIGGSGQLFHTEDEFVFAEKQETKEIKVKVPAGLYFLVQTESDLLEPALRLLEHYGIGGDRTIGKGRFRIQVEDYQLPPATDANVQMNLSLYHPTKSELHAIQQADMNLLAYKLEARKGWKTNQVKGAQKDAVLYFQEGSIFPLAASQASNILGCNQQVGKHDAGHTITQYGHGFMLNLKLPLDEA
ncbi:MAG: type III-A CRISPR-associated RAMP protein Csm4 [Bacteroidota bacterium]